jgi:ketol-acid reductoisomerase
MASSTASCLRALSRHTRAVPRLLTKKSFQTASYSLLARHQSVTNKRVSHDSSRPRKKYQYELLQVLATRGLKTLDFAGSKEVVYERSDWPLAKLQNYFKNDTLALIGYGSQGHGQGLNARDNGLNVIIGVRKDGESWRQAIEDGWVSLILKCPCT